MPDRQVPGPIDDAGKRHRPTTWPDRNGSPMTPSERPLPPPGGTSEWRSRSSTISEGERMGGSQATDGAAKLDTPGGDPGRVDRRRVMAVRSRWASSGHMLAV